MKIVESMEEPRRPSSGLPTTEQERRLRAQIQGRVKGLIDNLDVVCSEEEIIVRGISRSYHAKQLAQKAILDLTDGFPLLSNQIIVY